MYYDQRMPTNVRPYSNIFFVFIIRLKMYLNKNVRHLIFRYIIIQIQLFLFNYSNNYVLKLFE